MSEKPKQKSFDSLRQPLLVVAAIAVGVGIGRWNEPLGLALAPYGRLYLSLLLMCIIPLLFTAIISSLGQMVAKHQLGRRLVVILLVFAVGLVLAAAIGTGIGWITGVGADLRESKALGSLLLRAESTSAADSVDALSTSGREEHYAELFSGNAERHPAGQSAVAGGAAESSRGFVAYLFQLIPQNLAGAILEENYLAVLFFSLLMGVALGFAPVESRTSALLVLAAFFDSLLRIIGWVIFLLPAGLIFIVAGQVARGGLDFVPVLGKLIGVSLVTTVVTILLFAMTISWSLGLRLPAVFRGLRSPLVVALATSSSLASIPAAMVALKREFGLAEENVKLLLPLGVMLNPIGSALFFSLSAIFAVQLHAQSPTILQLDDLLMIVIGAVLAALAAMGLPGPSSVWMLGIVLGPIGVPPEVGIIALMAVSPIIDPLFTAVNVAGNCTATCILDRRLSGGVAAARAGESPVAPGAESA